MEQSNGNRSYQLMSRQRASRRGKRRTFEVVALVLGLLLSLSVHHVGVAAEPLWHQHGLHHHAQAVDEHPAHCEHGNCQTQHTILACCAMGLCLTGLPAQPPASFIISDRVPPETAAIAFHATLFRAGIDRPPKFS